MSEGRLSGIQRLFTGLVSPATAARMEAESRGWMVQCPNCGYEQSVWDTGGVRYKASGNSYQSRRCPNCGKVGMHKVYRKEGAPSAISAIPVEAPTATGRPRWLLWPLVIALPLVAIAIFVALLLLLINTFTQPVATAGDDFMAALQTGNYTQAYALCSPDLQKELGGAGGLAKLAQGYRPSQWNWTSRSIRNGVGRVDGSLTFTNGKTGTAHLVLQQVGNNWRIVSFNLSPTGQVLPADQRAAASSRAAISS